MISVRATQAGPPSPDRFDASRERGRVVCLERAPQPTACTSPQIAVGIVVAVLIAAAVPARAAPSLCPEHFASGQAPEVVNPRLATGTKALCFRAFAVLHSAVTRGPLYSAERLTAEDIEGARAIPREGDFHAEGALPESERAELADYARSGFDRGHMAPAGDMPDPRSQQESFSLANVVPQVGEANRGLWEGVESGVRTLATRRGELYVVTGPVFQGARLQQLRGRVLVPTHTFKAVLDPRRGQAGAYVMTNSTDPQWQVVSIQQLSGMTGLDVFPGLSARAKASAMRLPEPVPYDARRRGGGSHRRERFP